MVTRIKTEAEMINYSNTKAEIVVTNSNTEADMITNCNTEAEMVTRIKTEADIVTYSDAEAEIVANSNTEADIVFRSNTVLENFESHTQNNEIQLQDSLVKDQIKTTHVNCFCSPCKVLFTSLKKLNAHAWFVHTQRQCVICHTYFTNHLCMCNHECARVILQMKINPMSQIVLHFGSEDKILEKVRGHGNQWYVFVKDNPMTLEETKTKDLRLPCYCRTCKIGLISLSQLNNHIYDVHTTRAECIYCKMDFNSTEEMGDHFCEKLKTKLKENILTEITACPCLETYDKYSRRGVEMITLPWLRMSAKTLRQLAEEKLDKTVHPLVDALSIYRKKTKYRQCRRKKKSIEQRLADAKKQRKKYQEKHKDRYKCEICQEKFTYYIMLRKHIANEHERETFGCNICNMQFKHKKTLERHQMKGHLQVCEKEKPKHTCFVCDKKYSTSRSLRRHNFKEHLIEDKHISKLRENVACEQCGKIVMRKCMRLHLLVHQEKEFMCEDCGEKFRRPDDLKRHRQKHLRKKYVLKSETSGYKCLICGLILSTNGAIKRHFSLKHSSEKIAIPCKICGRLYASKPVLDIHMKLKHSDKSFQCEICNKKFYYNYLLKNHVKIVHENYKPFQCDICNFRCYMKSALVSHMKYNH
ncbi:unnamed protein product [Mytilus edulis]|uniref:C2H2-type domain-containing protein n=1 Tax=Mytilus edulis TaxID=6550 RepID=A0A8S3R623_MYTED|nr:unnamed protein product [Mytilus edulis]